MTQITPPISSFHKNLEVLFFKTTLTAKGISEEEGKEERKERGRGREGLTQQMIYDFNELDSLNSRHVLRIFHRNNQSFSGFNATVTSCTQPAIAMDTLGCLSLSASPQGYIWGREEKAVALSAFKAFPGPSTISTFVL